MVQPRNAFSALLRFGIDRGRLPLLAGAALALCLGGVAPARAGTPPADPPGAAAPEDAAPEDAAKVPASEGSSLPRAATEVAAVRRPVEAKPQPSGDEQRRVLMLLLMNSAGPVRPFGGLGK